MKVLLSVAGYLLAFCVVVGALLDNQNYRREKAELVASLRDAEQRESIALAKYAEAASSVERDTVRVTTYATRYDTIRAELDPDTVQTVPSYWVKGLVLAADSTISACRALVGSCERLKLAADSTIAATRDERDAYKNLYNATRPTWKQRFGISCGYSVVKVGSDVKAGPSCGAQFRVWP